MKTAENYISLPQVETWLSKSKQSQEPVITTNCLASTYLNVCQSLVMMKTSVRTISDYDHIEDNDNDHYNDFETFS